MSKNFWGLMFLKKKSVVFSMRFGKISNFWKKIWKNRSLFFFVKNFSKIFEIKVVGLCKVYVFVTNFWLLLHDEWVSHWIRVMETAVFRVKNGHFVWNFVFGFFSTFFLKKCCGAMYPRKMRPFSFLIFDLKILSYAS